MTQQMSAGLKFREALETEKPLQIIGTVNAYAAMVPVWPIILMDCLTWV